ncbi:hypothetical protein PRIPAC_93678 [Pristionchus pacificus]|uniref:Uncharacterized protein n=1 Tax=Pristionchus pacificus TaxID=54126 RepID=A0A2A6BII3_PRIPA|nr:hypothetical protein PRIPAC_93678 [Pristionchus pacificus]|eukprot:PDM65720.1 hypothetical protein PRIPAC_45634 [Pristionchus pacificus]
MSPTPTYKSSLLSSKRPSYDSEAASSSPVTRKSWTVENLVKHDDVEGQLDPTRAFVDQCYANFASVNILKVLVKYGAPMKPCSTLELEPVCHYAIAYHLKRKSMNSRRREKFLEVIQYLKEAGHPTESTNYSLSLLEIPICSEMCELLAPSVLVDATLSRLSPSSTDSSMASSTSTQSTTSSIVDTEDILQTDGGEDAVAVATTAVDSANKPQNAE